MSKSNKELAVELYSAFLKCAGGTLSSPNFKGTITLPTSKQMVEEVKLITDLLKDVKDE